MYAMWSRETAITITTITITITITVTTTNTTTTTTTTTASSVLTSFYDATGFLLQLMNLA